MGRPPSVGGLYQSRKMESVTQLPAALSLWRLVRLTMALLGLPGTSYRGQSPSSPISLRPRLQGEQSRYSKSELPARDWNFFCFLEEELPMMGGEERGSHWSLSHHLQSVITHNKHQLSRAALRESTWSIGIVHILKYLHLAEGQHMQLSPLTSRAKFLLSSLHRNKVKTTCEAGDFRQRAQTICHDGQ